MIQQVIDQFIVTADARFGSITTIRKDGVTKRIPWRAFRLTAADWNRVSQLIEILKVRRYRDSERLSLTYVHARTHNVFNRYSLSRSFLPCGERFQRLKGCRQHGKRRQQIQCTLCTHLGFCWRWTSCASIIAVLISDHCIFWQSVSTLHSSEHVQSLMILLLLAVIHPYYKLRYIAQQWGAEKEQAEEIAKGCADAKNWLHEAEVVVKKTVSMLNLYYSTPC